MKKAPGKSHREGISLEKLFQMFPDDATAEKWFVEQRWPDGAHCPHCGSVNVTSNCSPLIQAPKTQQQFQSQLLRHDASFTFGCGDSNRLLLILSLRLSFSARFVQSGSTAREFMT